MSIQTSNFTVSCYAKLDLVSLCVKSFRKLLNRNFAYAWQSAFKYFYSSISCLQRICEFRLKSTIGANKISILQKFKYFLKIRISNSHVYKLYIKKVKVKVNLYCIVVFFKKFPIVKKRLIPNIWSKHKKNIKMWFRSYMILLFFSYIFLSLSMMWRICLKTNWILVQIQQNSILILK